MTGLVRKATFLAVCGLLTAGVAMAHVPDPAHCTCSVPNGCIYVTGHNGVVGDPAGAFCITVRDFNNVPLENSSVIIDFSGCDIQLCLNQLDPDAVVDCVTQTVRKLTNASGVACFRIIGKSRPNLGCASPPGQGPNCVQIFADSQFLCQFSAPTFDLVNAADGSGVGAADLAAWLSAKFCGTNPKRADYICDGVVGAGDLARWLTIRFAHGSDFNCPPPKNSTTGPKCP